MFNVYENKLLCSLCISVCYVGLVVCKSKFNKMLAISMVVGFIGGGNLSAHRKPQTYLKSHKVVCVQASLLEVGCESADI